MLSLLEPLLLLPVLLAGGLSANSKDIQLPPSSAGRCSVRLLVSGNAGVFGVSICQDARSSFNCLPSSQRLLKRSLPPSTPVRTKLFRSPLTFTLNGRLLPGFLSSGLGKSLLTLFRSVLMATL